MKQRRPVGALAAALSSLSLLLVPALSACRSDGGVERSSAPAPPASAPSAADEGVAEAEEAARFVEDRARAWWDLLMEQNPTWATSVGDHRFDDRLSRTGPDARDEQRMRLFAFAADLEERAAGIEEQQLSAADALTLELLRYEVARALEGERLGLATFDVDQMNGPQATLPYFFHHEHPMTTRADVENLIARYRALTPWMDGHIEDLRVGLQAGQTAPRVVVERVLLQLRELLKSERRPAESTFAKVAARIPDDVSDDRALLEADVLAATRESVLPSLRRYLSFLEKEYLPKARKEPGLGSMSGGAEIYAWLAKRYTTTALSPEEIHALGRRELARIEAEIQKLALVRGQGTKEQPADAWAFVAKLKADKAQYAKSREALMVTFREALKRADAKLPEAFGRLPAMAYEVKPMDKERERDAPAAYYQPGSASDGRPGIFVANLHRFEERPVMNSEALAFHEAVPGHHIQIAIAQELEGLPRFRSEGYYVAFGEGWGLYAERLADELGLYSSLESRVGYLGFAAWRASRLVVDTGLHQLGWTRQQAVDFLARHTTLGAIDVANEIDRYIAMPGQALGYMVGMLRILELRERARAKLGPEFDLKAFHDALLGAGALPLDLIDRRVARELGL